MRIRAKRDANEREIIEALKAVGCTVWQVNDEAVPDLLVGTEDGRNLLFEVKVPGGTLTPKQLEFHRYWKADVYVVTSVTHALLLAGGGDALERYNAWKEGQGK